MNGPLQACPGKIAGGALADVQKHKIVRRGTIHATAYEADRHTVRGDMQVAKWAVRSEKQLARAVRDRDRKNLVSVFIGFRMIRRTDNQVGARRKPGEFADCPLGVGKRPGVTGCESE